MNFAEIANLVREAVAAMDINNSNKLKKIVCYGDSNTFGFNPADFSRYDESIRWTCVLKKNLVNIADVINEGACDRTGFVDNPKGFLYSAQKHFPKMLSETKNIDILILWIGTNDLQFQYDISFKTVENGLENLIRLAKGKSKQIIIIPPVILNEKILDGYFNYQFDKTSICKSKKIGEIFKNLAEINHCEYLDINKTAKPSNIDGLHYDEKAHKLIGEKISDYIKFILK